MRAVMKIAGAGAVIFFIGVMLMLIHHNRWGHPFAHGDGLGMIGLFFLGTAFLVGVFGLLRVWSEKRQR